MTVETLTDAELRAAITYERTIGRRSRSAERRQRSDRKLARLEGECTRRGLVIETGSAARVVTQTAHATDPGEHAIEGIRRAIEARGGSGTVPRAGEATETRTIGTIARTSRARLSGS